MPYTYNIDNTVSYNLVKFVYKGFHSIGQAFPSTPHSQVYNYAH